MLTFVLAVVFIVASVYAASLVILHLTKVPADGAPAGAAYKFMRLARGGSEVAEEPGGRLLAAEPGGADERRLRNVVEEMALAAGVPVPKVYVLDQDAGINAFAAGHRAEDAAIGVTRGSLALLMRDELQDVVGHEFSHLLNGDMRLNIRIMGVLFGIVCLTVIGRVLLYARGGDSRGRAPPMLLGVALLVIGAPRVPAHSQPRGEPTSSPP